MSRRLATLLLQAIAALVLIGGWEACSRQGVVDRSLLPPFSVVAGTLFELLGSAVFLGNAFDTALRVAASFLIAAPLALLVGFVMGENRRVGRIFGPLFNTILAVPQSIFLPIFILALGLQFAQKLAFGMTHVFFIVAVSTMAAIRQVPAEYVLAARSFGAGRARIYRSIYMPAMAAQVVTGLRLGLIFDITGILLAEMYGSRSGLGVLIFRWGEAYDEARLMAAIIFVSLATIVANELMRIWEVKFARWQR